MSYKFSAVFLAASAFAGAILLSNCSHSERTDPGAKKHLNFLLKDLGNVPDRSTEPTGEPTSGPTTEPTVDATTQPVATPEPTSTPTIPPVIEGAIRWNYNDQAIAAGTGCHSSGDDANTFFISAGNEMTIVISRMGLALDTENAPLAERQACSVRVPVRLMPGYYIGGIENSLTYSVTKSGGSSGEITTNVSAMQLPANAITVKFPYGTWNDETNITKTAITDTTSSAAEQCRTPGRTGLYAYNIAIAGQRDNPYEGLRIGLNDGADFRVSNKLLAYSCGGI